MRKQRQSEANESVNNKSGFECPAPGHPASLLLGDCDTKLTACNDSVRRETGGKSDVSLKIKTLEGRMQG